MRLIPFVLAAVTVLVPRLAAAQEWIEYVNQQDFFSVNFPHEPTIEAITYNSAQGAPLPGRVYTANSGASKFFVGSDCRLCTDPQWQTASRSLK